MIGNHNILEKRKTIKAQTFSLSKVSTLSLLFWVKYGLYHRAALGICTLTVYLGQVISVCSDIILNGTGLCCVTQVISPLQTVGRTDKILGGLMNYSLGQMSDSSYDVIHPKSPLPARHYSSWPLTLQLCYSRSCQRECAELQGALSAKPVECLFKGMSMMIREQQNESKNVLG